MQQIRIICATRGRPELCRRLLTSFEATRREDTGMLVYLEDTDQRLSDYLAVRSDFPQIQWVIGPERWLVDAINYGWKESEIRFPAKFYGDVGDDNLYQTEGWDRELRQTILDHGGSGMAYGATQNLPVAMLASRDCVRALGWYYPTGFRHMFADNVVAETYGEAGLLYHRPDVLIAHLNPAFGSAPHDETYARAQCTWGPDRAAYDHWREHRRAGDVAKLRALKA
jgi:hypothetical protein